LKKGIAILLFTVYFASSLHLTELLKIPMLVEHFQEHKKSNEAITLWHFLCMHYNDQPAHDNEDAKLPFKSVCHFGHCAMPVIITSTEHVFAHPQVFSYLEKEEKSNTYTLYLLSNYLSCIWQPPKFTV
jgi:hypothetical protein